MPMQAYVVTESAVDSRTMFGRRGRIVLLNRAAFSCRKPDSSSEELFDHPFIVAENVVEPGHLVVAVYWYQALPFWSTFNIVKLSVVQPQKEGIVGSLVAIAYHTPSKSARRKLELDRCATALYDGHWYPSDLDNCCCPRQVPSSSTRAARRHCCIGDGVRNEMDGD